MKVWSGSKAKVLYGLFSLALLLALSRQGFADASNANGSKQRNRHPDKSVRLQRSLERHVDQLAMRHLYMPHYQSKNVRWGFLGRSRKVKLGLKEAEARLERVMTRLVGQGRLEGVAAERLSIDLGARLKEHYLQTRGKTLMERLPLSQAKRFPQNIPSATGSRQWWKWLKKATHMVERPYSNIKLLIDGPAWRASNKKLIRNSKGFLHIASWGWHNDEQGRWFANQIIARKLGMSPRELTRQRKKTPLKQIRDQQLAYRLIKAEEITYAEAKARVALMSESKKRQLVSELIDPLEVRVLLGNLIQRFQMRREQLFKTGTWTDTIMPDLKSVGVEVLFDNRIFERDGVRLENAYAVVPHAKLTISGDHALTGGMNIGNVYLNPKHKNLDWHDAAVSVRGEIVGDLNDSFINHWNRAARRRLGKSSIDRERKSDGGLFYFPHGNLAPQGEALLVGTRDKSKTKKPTYSYRTSLMMALAGARESFSMVTPYLTSPLLVKQLVRTAERFRAEGRDPSQIQVTITGKTDTPLTGRFVTGHFVHLLQSAGIDVRYWTPSPGATPYRKEAVLHAKAWIADGKVAYLGSANGTVRSLVQDWEIGLLIKDPGFIQRLQDQLFKVDAPSRIKPPARSLFNRAAGHSTAILFGPILRLL